MDEDELQNLEKKDLESLRPEFYEEVVQLRNRIMYKMRPKKLNGKLLNGDMYISLISSYIDGMNKGAVPNIENAWNYLCRDECQKAVHEAI